MVSVPADHRSQIFFRIVVEMHSVIVFVLPRMPAVKGFIHHQESHFIAKIQELRSRGIVTGPDRIAAHFLQDG